jgi:hypothetical protein
MNKVLQPERLRDARSMKLSRAHFWLALGAADLHETWHCIVAEDVDIALVHVVGVFKRPNELTGTWSAKRGGNPTAVRRSLLGCPVERRVGRHAENHATTADATTPQTHFQCCR